MGRDTRRILLHASKLVDVEECIIFTPTRFCLKNMGDPSSMNIAKPTAKKRGDKIKNSTIAITLFMNFESL